MTITTLSATTSEIRILRNHPVREEFAGRTTTGSDVDYYRTKGHAVNAFDGVLQGYDLCLDRDDLMDFSGDEGRKTIEVHDEFGRCAGHAVLSWYRMPSGRYEFTGCLA
jgi:hypothetical protein